MKREAISLAVMILGAFLVFIGLTVFINTSIIGGIALLISGAIVCLISLILGEYR